MKQQKIYQSTFASVYDQIYGDKFYQQYVFFIKKIIYKNKLENIKILDLACGTGKLIQMLSRELNKKNHLIIEGADASLAMINVAKKRNKKIKFYNQNFTNLATGKKYDIIISTFDSINYVLKKQDLLKTFDRIAKHLNRGGVFIFDFNTNYKKVEKIFTHRQVTYHNLIEGRYWNIKIIIQKRNKNCIERHIQRLYSLKEIESIIFKSKFKIKTIYSDFNKRLNRLDKDQRLFVIVKKAY